MGALAAGMADDCGAASDANSCPGRSPCCVLGVLCAHVCICNAQRTHFGPRALHGWRSGEATSCNRRCRFRPSFIRCMRLWSRVMLQPLRGPWPSTKRPLRSRLVVVCVPFSRPASLLAIAYARLERMRSRFTWSSAKAMTTIVERALDFIPLDWPHRGVLSGLAVSFRSHGRRRCLFGASLSSRQHIAVFVRLLFVAGPLSVDAWKFRLVPVVGRLRKHGCRSLRAMTIVIRYRPSLFFSLSKLGRLGESRWCCLCGGCVREGYCACFSCCTCKSSAWTPRAVPQ